MIELLPANTFGGWLIEGVIAPARCDAIVAELGARGFERTAARYPADYRNNDRLVFDDAALAAELFAQLASHVPAEIVEADQRWQLYGFNARFRACRYAGGQAFCIHRDGAHVPSDDVRSMFTVQLYLDDDPARSGGRTRFYADPRGDVMWSAITPVRGTVIVFDHRVWHDGESVTQGVKHVLRTDVMYRRVGDADIAVSPQLVGRHRGYAWRAIACADGSIASGGRDGTIRRWPSEHASDLARGSITALVEASDGALWCGTRTGEIVVLDGAPMHTMHTMHTMDTGHTVHTSDVAVLALATRGAVVVASTSDGFVHAFALDHTHRWSTHAHTSWAWSVIPREEEWVACGHDGRITVIDPRTGRAHTFAELRSPIRAIAAIGDTLVAGDTRGWLHYLTRGGEVFASTRAHTAAITSLAVRGDELVSGSEDGAFTRWRDRRAVATTRTNDFVTSVAYLGDDLLVAGYDGAIRRVTTMPASIAPTNTSTGAPPATRLVSAGPGQ